MIHVSNETTMRSINYTYSFGTWKFRQNSGNWSSDSTSLWRAKHFQNGRRTRMVFNMDSLVLWNERQLFNFVSTGTVRRPKSTSSWKGSRFEGLFGAGWGQDIRSPHQTLVSTFPWMDWWWLTEFSLNGSVTITKQKSQNGSVAKGWLSTSCCWEAAVQTLD